MDWHYGKSKRRLFGKHPDRVVVIGSGVGANMRYLRKGTTVIVIEPNIHMHANHRKSSAKYGINLEIQSLIGESIDLPDNSCDFVISTLMLCTVHDPKECISQIKRILRSNGSFVFIEHVKAKENTAKGLIQRACKLNCVFVYY